VTSDGMTKFNTSQDCPYHACQVVGAFNDWINNEILSAVEQRNIKAIQDVENQKKCRRTVPGACSRP
jgi:hypothetical protein